MWNARGTESRVTSYGFNWDKWTTGTPTQRLALVPAGQQHILEQDNGKKRWIQVVKELSRAFALCAASEEATKTREGIGLRDKTRRRSWPDG